MQRKGKRRITDILFRELLFKELNAGSDIAHTKYLFYELIVDKYAIHKARALELWDRYFAEWSELMKQAQDEASKKTTKAGLKSGVRKKLDRVLFYQREIDLMEKQLRGEQPFTFVLGKGVMNSHRGDVFVAPVEIQNQLRQTIKAYQTEISKIEGDYAPIRSDVKSGGKEIKAQVVPMIRTADGTVISF